MHRRPRRARDNSCEIESVAALREANGVMVITRDAEARLEKSSGRCRCKRSSTSKARTASRGRAQQRCQPGERVLPEGLVPEKLGVRSETAVAQLEDTLTALQKLDFAPEELAEIDGHATEGEIDLWKVSSTL